MVNLKSIAPMIRVLLILIWLLSCNS